MFPESYHVIDIANWPRKEHFSIFKNYLIPQYSVSFDLDISNFYIKVKQRNLPFTLSLIYIVAKCANKIENFRYRFECGKVVLYDRIGTSFTYMDQNSDLFKQINVKMQSSLQEYLRVASSTINNQIDYFIAPPGNDTFIFSPIPWVSFKNISHTFSGNKDKSAPMFDWGKYYRNDKQILLPFSVQVHHSFVDGIHIGNLYSLLQAELDNF